jgi:hypothetical protein
MRLVSAGACAGGVAAHVRPRAVPHAALPTIPELAPTVSP